MPNWRKWLIAQSWIARYAVRGVLDALRRRRRPRFEFTVLIKAPRDVVWRLNTADRLVMEGPPVVEYEREPLSGFAGFYLTRVAIAGRPPVQIVTRELERDEAKGIAISRSVPHALSSPSQSVLDLVSGAKLETTSHGTLLTAFAEFTVRSFRDRIVYPVASRQWTDMFKQRCEQEVHRRSAAAGDARQVGTAVPTKLAPATSIGNRAIGLSLAVAVGILVGVVGSAMLPTAYEREFDQDLAHYPLAASLAQRDPQLRKLLMRRTEVAYNKGGWPAAQATLDAILASEVMIYADDAHIVAMARHRLRVLGALEKNPADCKAYMLTGAQLGEFPEAKEVLEAYLPIKSAALQNGFDRKSEGLAWGMPLSDDALARDTQSLYVQPVSLSRAEVAALDAEVDGDAAQYCSASIKRLVNLLARPASEVARIERQLIYYTFDTGREDWSKDREALCRQRENRPAGLACPQAAPAADSGRPKTRGPGLRQGLRNG